MKEAELDEVRNQLLAIDAMAQEMPSCVCVDRASVAQRTTVLREKQRAVERIAGELMLLESANPQATHLKQFAAATYLLIRHRIAQNDELDRFFYSAVDWVHYFKAEQAREQATQPEPPAPPTADE